MAVDDYKVPSFDTSVLSNTWLAKLFGYIHTNRAESDLEAVFENIRVVTFNYDRTFEQFIFIAVCNFYQVTLQRALDLLGNINITHVYGSLGTLGVGPDQQEFATCRNDIEIAARRIQIFHESVGSETIARINEAVQWCERVFILGFSFAPMNMGLFQNCQPQKKPRSVFATNYKLSDFNSDIARTQLDRIFGQDTSVTRLFPVECPRFFDEIQLTI